MTATKTDPAPPTRAASRTTPLQPLREIHMLNSRAFDHFIRVYLGVAATFLPLTWAAHLWPRNALALMTAVLVGWSLGLAYALVHSTWRRSSTSAPPALRGDAQFRNDRVIINWTNVQSAMGLDDADRLAEHLRALTADARKKAQSALTP
ncbi:hypothetical protein AB0F17_34635 [Nonomuraea sp. NPDC026600]|uniref:hypothetical protein n=1 Tax=Nonomuraea sp. NPDC026600 TaxID=3155363 RepID=UPI0033DBB4E6